MNKKKFFALLIFVLAVLAGTAGANPFDNPEFNRLIDDNYAIVQKDGWA